MFPSNFVTEITEADSVTEQNTAQHSRGIAYSIVLSPRLRKIIITRCFIYLDSNKLESDDKIPSKNGADEGPVLPPKPKLGKIIF